MKYLEWNNLIAQQFFNKQNAGKDIHLYITKEDIINLGKRYFDEESDEEVWEDFVKKVKNGIPGSSQYPFIIDKAIFSYHEGKRKGLLKIEGVELKYPPYIAYLVFLILPLIEVGGNYNANNYYDRLNEFLVKNDIKQNLRNRLIDIEMLWIDLRGWANIQNNGEKGFFRLRHFINQNWIYVGKIFSQCVFPPRLINKLPEVFYSAGLIPNSTYSQQEFRRIILNEGSMILNLRDNITQLIKSETNELGQSILEIIKREYGRWTGETLVIEHGNIARRNYTVVPLFLQFKVNINDAIIEFSYRFFSTNEYPEDLEFEEFNNLYEARGWSKVINRNFEESFVLTDNFNRWVAKFPNRDVRIFTSAGNYQLSTSYWIETKTLSRNETMFLMCRNEIKQSIFIWGQTFKPGDFIEEDLEGIPENYSIFRIVNPTQSHPNIPLLTLYTIKKVEILGGLRINFRTFVNDYLPEVRIVNTDGNENVYIQYRNSEDVIYLQKSDTCYDCWKLPEQILINVDFSVRIDSEYFIGSDTFYHVISSNDSALKVMGNRLPKRDTFGRSTSDEELQYCIGSNVINPSKASKRSYSPWTNLILSLTEDNITNINLAAEGDHCGNKLGSFLSLKSVSTTEDFYRAFEFYFSKQFIGDEINFNLTAAKKSAINFYDYIGFLDYDYEMKSIVVNPPQFIFIPSAVGRKVLLIGGRDSSLIREIISKSRNHNLQVEIKPQFSSNKKLLLPDALTIRAFGNSANGYGEKDIVNFANEIGVEFSNEYFPQLALLLFSAKIEDYENALELTDENDFDWARKIFNPETLSYEKNEREDFDKTFSLVEYKLNEYTYYHKLWINGKCYSIDKNWGKYLTLKNGDRHVILFDKTNHRVAIPVNTPLPRLLSESLMLLSGLAPDFRKIEQIYYRVYENIPGIFTENLFKKLGQTPIKKDL